MQNELTQGTLISGVRSDKFPGVRCYGIVITARCDLANCKVSKIYYLTAVSYEDWLTSEEGFDIVLASKKESLENGLKEGVEKNDLDWGSLKTFSDDEIVTIIFDGEVGLNRKDAKKWYEQFIALKRYKYNALKKEDIYSLYKQERKTVITNFEKIINGKMIHLAYLPESAYIKGGENDKGLIVDFQEVDAISLSDAEKLLKYEIDIKNEELTQSDIERYDKIFYLKESPGYAIVEGKIESPWIEYIMQRFSNAFIRIGIDCPEKEQVQNMIDRMI